MAKERGLRSSNDAKPWRCRCGTVNRPTRHRFFDLPAFHCSKCRKQFDRSFKICLGEIEVDGRSLIGEVQDQGNTLKCLAIAYCKAQEIVERVSSVNDGKDPDEVTPINHDDLEEMFNQKFPGFSSLEILSKDLGIHRYLHMGLILRDEGIIKDEYGDICRAEDLSAIPRDDFEQIARCLSEGIPFLATYHAGIRRGKLRYCQIYKSPRRSRKQRYRGHAVVLIGAGMRRTRRFVGKRRRRRDRRFFYFLNSWGNKFCARRNIHGEIIKGGIGKIRAEDLSKNVIKLSQPRKTDACWSLKAQNDVKISDENYVLLMGTKKQHAARARIEELRRNSKKAMSRKQQSDEIDFDEMKEDHLVHGPFCDDEAGYPQAAEDCYDAIEVPSMEMEGLLVEDLPSKRQHARPASPAGNIKDGAIAGLGEFGSEDMESMPGLLILQNFMCNPLLMNRLLLSFYQSHSLQLGPPQVHAKEDWLWHLDGHIA